MQMTATKLKRRTLAKAAMISAGALISARLFSASVKNEKPLLLSAATNRHGEHMLTGATPTGSILFSIPVNARAHDICTFHNTPKAVYFSRRPGDSFHIVDLDKATLTQTISAKHGYHFYGHGVLSADDHYLFTTENDFQKNRGIVGVYDTTDNFKRVDEFNSGDIGPHQLAFLSDNKTLAIANGGIQTHPSQPRKKLNLDTMTPSLVYLDTQNGSILDRYEPEEKEMSIRHLAVTKQDAIILGIQHQSKLIKNTPLVLCHQGEQMLKPFSLEDKSWSLFNNYIASIAVDDTGLYAIGTSPRGDCAAIFEISTMALTKRFAIRDVAGASYSPSHQAFLTSNGYGQVFAIPVKDTTNHGNRQIFQASHLQWDNHLNTLTTLPTG